MYLFGIMLLFKYSYKDALLVFLLLIQGSIQLILLFFWYELNVLVKISGTFLLVYLYYLNIIAITHSFLHTPFFKSRILNKFFSVIDSIVIMFPVSFYKESHLIHHRYNNDSKVNGKCKDPTSTYYYGKNGRQENAFKYCLLGVFRDWTVDELISLKNKKYLPVFLVETAGILIYLLVGTYINWQWTVFVIFPVYFTGWFFANMQNYYEHYHAADQNNWYANSVSYYGKWFNIFVFNEGYHQEHHIRPNTHWTMRPAIKERFAKEMKNGRYKVIHFPFVVGFLEDFFKK